MNQTATRQEKLLVLSDIHYPIGSIRIISAIIKKEKPANIALLGDNIELSMFDDPKYAFREFYSSLNKIFPINKSIIILGDNDYQYAKKNNLIKIVESYNPINKGALLFFKKGRMNFFHGNLEKSMPVEKIGHHFVKISNRISQRIAPWLLANMIRLHFGIKRSDYLFMGHLHYLGLSGKNIFCGTLNYKFMPFSNSLGYVTVLHKGFVVSENSINLIRIKK